MACSVGQGRPIIVCVSRSTIAIAQCGTIIREIAQLGFQGRLAVNGDLSSPGFLEDVGSENMEGACNGQAVPDADSESFQSFNETWVDLYDFEAYVTLPNAYDTIFLVALAGIQGGAFDGKTIRDNLVDVANPPGTQVSSFEEAVSLVQDGEEIDYQGASGPLDFDGTGSSRIPFSVLCVQNGEWTSVFTVSPA